MKLASSVFTAVLICAGVSHASVLNFDGISDSGDGTAVTTYQGFNFTNGYVLNAVQYGRMVGANGYTNGVTSSPNVYLNGNGGETVIFLASPGTFTLNSFELTAAWSNNLNVEVLGLAKGVTVDTKNLVVSTFGPTLETFNWSGIDTLELISSGGNCAGYAGSGEHFAIDDFTYNATAATPEPGSLALLSTGVGALGLVRRRLRRSAE